MVGDLAREEGEENNIRRYFLNDHIYIACYHKKFDDKRD